MSTVSIFVFYKLVKTTKPVFENRMTTVPQSQLSSDLNSTDLDPEIKIFPKLAAKLQLWCRHSVRNASIVKFWKGQIEE